MPLALPSKSYGIRIMTLSGKGPASEVSIAAGGSGSVSIEIENPFVTKNMVGLLSTVSGLPSTLAIYGISISTDDGKVTVTIDVKNLDSSNAATVAAGSVSVTIAVIG